MTEKKSEEFINGISRSWAITWNNYKEDDINLLKGYGKECSYLIWGEEVGESGTPHLQITITFRKAKRFNAVKKLFSKCHVEKCRDINASIMYCKKEGKYTEIDNREQGLRTDLKLVAKTINEQGLNKALIAFPDMYIKYHNGMEKLNKKLHTKKRNFKPLVIWIHGPTGCGKSHLVHSLENDLWVSMESLQWWEDYQQQRATLFDDFRIEDCKFNNLLKLLDRYPYKVPIKGTSTELSSWFMYITTPLSPEKMYKDEKEDVKQLTRRITFEIEFLNCNRGSEQLVQLKSHYNDYIDKLIVCNISRLKVILNFSRLMFEIQNTKQ